MQGGDQQPGAGGHVQTWERKPLGKMGERKRGFSFLILPQGGLCSAETQDLKGSRAQGGAGVRLRAGRWSEMQVGVLPAEREGWDCVCSEAGPEPRAPPSAQGQTQLSPFLPLTPCSGVLSIHPPPALPPPPSSDVLAPRGQPAQTRTTCSPQRHRGRDTALITCCNSSSQ